MKLFLAIKEEELPGIRFIEYKKRFYPNGDFASHLIGFAQEEEDEKGSFPRLEKWDSKQHTMKN